MNQRFMIKWGKYGAYYYDALEQKNMTLKEVEDTLNFYWNKHKQEEQNIYILKHQE